MTKLPLNVWILTVAQALMMSVSPIIVFIGGLIGAKLAPVSNMATLPIAAIIIGTALAVVPVTMVMKKTGRKKAFLFTAVYSVIISLCISYTVHIGSFYLFCFSVFLMGVSIASVMQFRFAAMESVSFELMPNAASSVLLGGIAAAFIGPEIALLGKDILDTEYTGSFILLVGLFVLSFFVLLTFRNPEVDATHSNSPQRSFREISKQPVFSIAILSAAIGYMIMSFIMTATPVSMHVMDGHSLTDTKFVIQSHILAMFLPSLIAGWTIRKMGTTKMMIIGLIAYLICAIIAFSGHNLANYWVSLVLLDIGWDFLFLGGATLLPQSYQPSERFKVQALNDFIVFDSQAIAALSAGWLVFALGWETILICTVPIIIFQMVFLLRWSYKK
jgi:MFS family permease